METQILAKEWIPHKFLKCLWEGDEEEAWISAEWATIIISSEAKGEVTTLDSDDRLFYLTVIHENNFQ